MFREIERNRFFFLLRELRFGREGYGDVGTRSSVMLVLYEYEGVDLYALCLANIWCRQMGILRKGSCR